MTPIKNYGRKWVDEVIDYTNRYFCRRCWSCQLQPNCPHCGAKNVPMTDEIEQEICEAQCDHEECL